MNFDALFHNGLSLDRLRAFLAVARAGSVIKAAQGSQSVRSLMSRQIGELEKTLGIELFHRLGKSLVLTETGRELALLTAAYFDELAALVARDRERNPRLKIGAGSSILEAIVFPQLNPIRNRFSGFDFEFSSDSTAGLLNSLALGSLDMAIVRAGGHGGNLVHLSCGRIRFALAARLDFDSKLPGWTLRQILARVPLGIIRGEGEFVTAFKGLSDDLEVSPHVSLKTESFGQLRQAMIQGFPAAILPRPLTTALSPSEYLVLEDEQLDRLDRDIAVVIDKRVAKIKDRLASLAMRFCETLLAAT